MVENNRDWGPFIGPFTATALASLNRVNVEWSMDYAPGAIHVALSFNSLCRVAKTWHPASLDAAPIVAEFARDQAKALCKQLLEKVRQ